MRYLNRVTELRKAQWLLYVPPNLTCKTLHFGRHNFYGLYMTLRIDTD